MRSRRGFPATVALLTVVSILLSAGPAAAHENDEGILVAVGNDRVIVTTAVAFGQLGFTESDGDGLLTSDEFTAQRHNLSSSLVGAARDHASFTLDGEPVEIVGAGVPSLGEQAVEGLGSPYVVLALASDIHDGEVDDMELSWAFTGPSVKVVVSSDGQLVTGNLSDNGTATFSLSTWASVRSYFTLGVDHIRFGPDHLLFLLMLTLAAVGTAIDASTTWRTIKLVTAFTIGHAVSLALAFFEVVSVPAAIVEPAISLSIVAAAVFAIRGSTAEARPLLAALVGVVHGLGFASNLSGLGVSASQQIAALAAFNFGVDLAQTVVVLAVIGVLWIGTKALEERISWVRFAGAVGAAIFGLAWTASRLVELPAG